MSAPKASVIIAHHNQSKILRLTLSALGQQSGVAPGELEVIVADDCSSPAELARVAKIICQSTVPTSLAAQRGVARYWVTRSRNNGIRLARGGIIVLLDGDMVPEQNLIETHLAAHDASRGSGVVVGGNRLKRPSFPTGDINLFWKACREFAPDASDPRVLSQAREDEMRMHFAQSEHPWRMVFGCNMSVPAGPQVFNDEALRGWAPDDWEMIWRLTHLRGLDVEYLPSAVAYDVAAMGDGVGSPYKNPTHERVKNYFLNMIHFHRQCPGMAFEDYFFGLRGFELGVDDRWVVTETNNEVDLHQRLSEVQDWLRRHGEHVDTNTVRDPVTAH